MEIGDRVRCTNLGRGSTLEMGNIYIIRGFMGNGWGNPDLICLHGVNGWFSQDSFELI